MFSSSERASKSWMNWNGCSLRSSCAARNPIPRRTPAGSSTRQISVKRRRCSSKFSWYGRLSLAGAIVYRQRGTSGLLGHLGVLRQFLDLLLEDLFVDVRLEGKRKSPHTQPRTIEQTPCILQSVKLAQAANSSMWMSIPRKPKVRASSIDFALVTRHTPARRIEVLKHEALPRRGEDEADAERISRSPRAGRGNPYYSIL